VCDCHWFRPSLLFDFEPLDFRYFKQIKQSFCAEQTVVPNAFPRSCLSHVVKVRVVLY